MDGHGGLNTTLSVTLNCEHYLIQGKFRLKNHPQSKTLRFKSTSQLLILIVVVGGFNICLLYSTSPENSYNG